MKADRYITRDKRILSGEPIIKGTRVPVSAILGQMSSNGLKESTVKRMYPQLTKAQIRACLDFPKGK